MTPKQLNNPEIELCREEFEKWCKQTFPHIKGWRLHRNKKGNYEYSLTTCAWRAWQAAYSTALTPQTDAWRPIEEAPKDGTYILVWSVEHCRLLPKVAYWHQGQHELNREFRTNEGQCLKPTHFMPLPAAPKVGEV